MWPYLLVLLLVLQRYNYSIVKPFIQVKGVYIYFYIIIIIIIKHLI